MRVITYIVQRLLKIIVRVALPVLYILSPSVNDLFKRLHQSPGIPAPNSSIPYWTSPPSPIAKHGCDAVIPLYADVVIIGSGITGTAVARTLLDYDARHGFKTKPLQVMVLEARDACSGATARNGGHITPILYQEYQDLVDSHGAEMAQKIIRFRLSHLPHLLAIAAEENLLEESQCREVDTFDVYHDKVHFRKAKGQLKRYQKDFPIESAHYKILENREQLEALQLSNLTAGCISSRGGSLHPYRLVTGILARLLRVYPSNFHLFTNTPCTAISNSESSQDSHLYAVTTPKGTIRTPHVVHATNGWTSHLLPGMRRKIFPARGVMTAQQPREGLGGPSKDDHTESWTGKRSFVFYPSSTMMYDYLTQQVPQTSPSTNADPSHQATYPSSDGELMFGGGFLRDTNFLQDLGNSNDQAWNYDTAKYLSGALGKYFSVTKDDDNESGRKEVLKAEWSGILGISVDQCPWVGRIPTAITGRGSSQLSERNSTMGQDTTVDSDTVQLAAPGEWIAAGYTGEGMVHAWRSGIALAHMVLGLDTANQLDEWFPDAFRITEERWKKAEVEELIASVIL